jgi:hypothetical protein
MLESSTRGREQMSYLLGERGSSTGLGTVAQPTAGPCPGFPAGK